MTVCKQEENRNNSNHQSANNKA